MQQIPHPKSTPIHRLPMIFYLFLHTLILPNFRSASLNGHSSTHWALRLASLPLNWGQHQTKTEVEVAERRVQTHAKGYTAVLQSAFT